MSVCSAAATGRVWTGSLSSRAVDGKVSESAGVTATALVSNPITACKSKSVETKVKESAAARFAACPALTVASSTSSSLASPASRLTIAMRRKLSASLAFLRARWTCSSAASALVYVVSASRAAAARSNRKRYWLASRVASADRIRALRAPVMSSGRSIISW